MGSQQRRKLLWRIFSSCFHVNESTHPKTVQEYANFRVPFFLLHLFTQETLIKSLAQSTHPWIGDYRKPTIGFKVDKHRMYCWYKRFSQNHWCLLACFLPSFLPSLLAGLLFRVKQQQQKRKQVIDFALDAMLVKYRYYYYYYYYYYIIHALWLPLQSFRIMSQTDLVNLYIRCKVNVIGGWEQLVSST